MRVSDRWPCADVNLLLVTAMIQDVGIVAPRVLKGVGEDRQRAEVAACVCVVRDGNRLDIGLVVVGRFANLYRGGLDLIEERGHIRVHLEHTDNFAGARLQTGK